VDETPKKLPSKPSRNLDADARKCAGRRRRSRKPKRPRPKLDGTADGLTPIAERDLDLPAMRPIKDDA
jgi:hypothetical protein